MRHMLRIRFELNIIQENVLMQRSYFVIMVALGNRATLGPVIYFYLSSFFPRLISAVGDWMSTILSTHGVRGLSAACEFRMHVWNVLHAARWNTLRKNRYFGTIAQLCQAVSSQLRHVSTIRKNLLNNDTSSTCPHNMVNLGLLTAEICWRVWGTPANFNGFRVLAALLHGTVVVGVSHALQR